MKMVLFIKYTLFIFFCSIRKYLVKHPAVYSYLKLSIGLTDAAFMV